MVSRKTVSDVPARGWWSAGATALVGLALAPFSLQTWLGQEAAATAFLSPNTYRTLLVWLGGRIPGPAGPGELLAPPWLTVAGLATAAVTAVWLIGGGGLLLRAAPSDRGSRLRRWTMGLGICLIALGLWDWINLPAVLIGGETGAALMTAAVPFWTALCLAAAATTWLTLFAAAPTQVHAPNDSEQTAGWSRGTTMGIGSLVAIYTLVFVTLNWRLWFNLLLPHGDSAMYEEHLWNLLHGKGFRSYLDQGLFLGEHIQVVHLGLLPLYVLWPSHLLLELCESLALGLGAFPVAWMTWRHTKSPAAATSAAAAYLLYPPLQFLDIEIDLKTFRPEAFGIPLLLLAFDQLDRGRWRGFLLSLLAVLTVKEDVVLVLAPLGLWVAATAWRATATADESPASLRGRRWLITGVALCLFSVFYLWLATRVLMPYFRPGQEIHYASYFSRLGDSPEAIARTILTRPGFVAGELLTLSTGLYALALLIPVGFVALCSPGRLLVGAPLFGVLCLNELARDPRHHFHAPLVAVVFWAVAAGLGTWADVCRWGARRWLTRECSTAESLAIGRRWLWTCSLATGLFFSLSPLGLPFWDPGSNWHWARLYGPGPRGTAFARVFPLIPPSARVASTDFVHPRFTHHERSYDYSDYARQVSGYERRVPDDTDFIVIDTTHPYSRYHTADDIPEARDHETWEVLPQTADGPFIVLRRRDPATPNR